MGCKKFPERTDDKRSEFKSNELREVHHRDRCVNSRQNSILKIKRFRFLKIVQPIDNECN